MARVIPGTGNPYAPEHEQRRAFAKAATVEFYQAKQGSYTIRWRRKVPFPERPYKVLVTNEGFAVLIDNWCLWGYGTIIAIYTPSGRLVIRYVLKDLFSPEEITRLPYSGPGANWQEAAYIRKDGRSVLIRLNFYILSPKWFLVLCPEDGSFLRCKSGLSLQCQANSPRGEWMNYRQAIRETSCAQESSRRISCAQG